MSCGQSVNNRTGSWYWLGKLWLGVLLCSTTVSADDTVVQLSMAQLESPRVQDGHLLGRGRVMCGADHARFRVWMAPEYLAPDQQSYILTLVESQQARLQIRLQGHGWQKALPSESGIVRSGSESSAVFDIVAHGEQQILPGIYRLRVSGTCL